VGRRGKYGDDADVAGHRHDPVRTALTAIIAWVGLAATTVALTVVFVRWLTATW
jgi:hypothetical protein